MIGPVLTLLLLAAPAGAAPAEVTPVSSDWVQLRNDGLWIPAGGLSPGAPLRWQVSAGLASPDIATFLVHLAGGGPLASQPYGLRATVSSCSQRWEGRTGTCRGSEWVLLRDQPLGTLRATAPGDLAQLRQDGQTWLLVTLSLPADTPEKAQGASAQVALGVTAAGGRSDPAMDLPVTGFELGTAAVLGLGLLGSGAVALVSGSRRLRRARS